MKHTVAEVVDIILGKGIPAGPINNVKQIVNDEHIRDAREMFVDVDHPVIGKMVVNGNPVKLMDMMPRVNMPAPTLGQHNEEIYKDILGIDDEGYKELVEKNVI